MALRNYSWRGNTWQFEESEAPDGAVPVEAERRERPAESKKAATPNKARRTANKSRKTATKA
mgnify:CR=1 FL=1